MLYFSTWWPVLFFFVNNDTNYFCVLLLKEYKFSLQFMDKIMMQVFMANDHHGVMKNFAPFKMKIPNSPIIVDFKNFAEFSKNSI